LNVTETAVRRDTCLINRRCGFVFP
jgi:hypothetical protein